MAQAQTVAQQTGSVRRIRARGGHHGLVDRLVAAYRRSRQRDELARTMAAATVGRQTGVRI